MCDSDKQPINEKGLHDAIINVEETHHQDPILSVKYSFPILLQFEWLLHLQSHSLQYNTHNNIINIPSSVNIHSLRVNIFNQIILDHTRRVRYVQWKLTPKVNFHKRFILFQHFSHSLDTSHSNSTVYHSLIPH
jgi:hypothetical protein